jgi:hypothetical protein
MLFFENTTSEIGCVFFVCFEHVCEPVLNKNPALDYSAGCCHYIG